MSNQYFRFKQFIVCQDKSAMKVTTDACLFGAWLAVVLKESTGRFLDIGAGTGLLSLMVAQKNQSHIDAVELDEPAFRQALENTGRSPWADRISVFHTAAQLFEPELKYDVIFSNPPFYQKDLRSPDQQRNVALHSKHLVLDELLLTVNRLLKPDGYFAVLLPPKRNAELEKMAADFSLHIVLKTAVRPTANHQVFRYMYLMREGVANNDHEIDEIIIREDSGHYTDKFFSLLEDYYLFEKKSDDAHQDDQHS